MAERPVDVPPLEGPLHFDALVTPHRSLSRSGFLIVMAVVAGISFFAGISFLTLGAWPVFGYFGLDVALIYWAFRMNYRAAQAHETVQVADDQILVRQIDHRGRLAAYRFPPLWSRVEMTELPDESLNVVLTAKGSGLEVGRLLSPAERRAFAEALEAAIAEVKAGRLLTAP